MKKNLAVLLILSLLFGVVSCTKPQANTEDSDNIKNTETKEDNKQNTSETLDEPKSEESEKGDEEQDPSEEPDESQTAEPDENDNEVVKNMLDGKKVIFIGDSFIYWGQVVLQESESRYNDEGYFYQLCKSLGATVSVTNWTYGGQGIAAIYDKYMKDLTDRYYDYVVISGGRNSGSKAEDYFVTLQAYKDVFTAVNPDVKFLYLVSSGAHNISVKESFPVDILNNLKEFEKMGITIVDWGKLVADIIRGNVAVPNAQKEYNKNTFIIYKSTSDGHHPNQLTGYITALMTYCAITGESAVGKPYDFWNDTSLNAKFSSRSYSKVNYMGGTEGKSNYTAVFDSESDMRGLQMLIDQYLEEKAYREYQFRAN